MHRFTRREFGGLVLTIGAQSSKLFAANSIDTVLHSRMEQRKIPAVTAVAGTASAITYSGAFGTRDSVSSVAVTPESIFSIASMTKAVTSVGAMQLVEQGKMTLDEPASKHLPELAVLQVLDGFDPAGKPILRPATKPVTLRQLLTHTSGFGYDIWNPNICRYMAENRIPGDCASRLITLEVPLIFDPGERWEYGISIDWVGRFVEAASRQNLEDYLRDNLFEPRRVL